MNHEEAIGLFTDLRHSRLDAERVVRLARHLAECPECPALVETLSLVQAGMHASDEDHPAAEAIVRLALDPAAPAMHDQAIESHVATCAPCREELSAIRRTELALRREDRARHAWSVAAAAAGIAVVLLAYPAYRGLVEMPAATREIDGLSARLRQETGRVVLAQDEAARERTRAAEALAQIARGALVTVQFLSRPSRGSGRDTITLDPDSLQLHLGVELESRDLPAKGSVRFALAQNDSEIFTLEQSAGSVCDQIRSPQGAVILAIPTSVLEPGEVTLSIGVGLEMNDGAWRSVEQRTFDLERRIAK